MRARICYWAEPVGAPYVGSVMGSRHLGIIYVRIAAAALVAFAATSLVRAQKLEPDPSRIIGQTVERQLLLEVESRLKSKDLATIAWGGYLAAQHRVALAVPMLKSALKDLPRGAHRKYTAQSLMDALVVHKAKVAGTDFADFRKGMNEGVAIALTAADPGSNREYLRSLFRDSTRGRFSRWLAAGNLLARIKDREFGRELVEQFAYDLNIIVTVEGRLGGFGMGGAFGGRFGDGWLQTPMGFPPVVTYRIVHKPKPGDVLVAEGKRPVYYRRQVHHERKVGIGSAERVRFRGRQELRVDWISVMLGKSVGELPPVETKTVYWTNNDEFVKRVAKHRREIEERHDRMLDRVIAAGWFTESERKDVAAKVVVKLHDHRPDKTVPLPKIL